MKPESTVLTLMTRQKAVNLAEEINEYQDEELYDTLENAWLTVICAEVIQGRMDPAVFYVCVELRSLSGDQLMYVPYDYYREHIRINKPVN